MTTPLRIDPFFDGESQRGPVAGGRQWLPGFNPAPEVNGYQDVGIDPDAARRMRGGGVIIPKATMDGIPQGTQPHNTKSMEVIIDPHLQGQSSVVRLGDVTKQSIASATQLIREHGIAPATDRETSRLNGSAIMQGIAKQASEMAPRSAPMGPTGPVYAGPAVPNIQAPHLAHVAGPLASPNGNGSNRVSRPLQYFQPQPPAPPPAAPAAAAPVMRQVNLAQPTHAIAEPPRQRVFFEIEQFGQHAVLYHDVVVDLDRSFMVLVYNSNYQGGSMYQPPVSDNPPKMALSIEGNPRVYLVQTTGLHYSYGDHEFCILMIEESGIPEEFGHDGQNG